MGRPKPRLRQPRPSQRRPALPSSGWVWEPKPIHVCTPPSGSTLDKHFLGAIWKCGECSQHWELAWREEERIKVMEKVSIGQIADKVGYPE